MSKNKFRVWCEDFQRWEEHKVLLAPDGQLYHMDSGRFLPLRSDNHIVEFCAGLSDKNGVEIYAGDIVSDGGRRRIVVFGKIGYDSSWNGLTGFAFQDQYDKDFDFYELNYYDDPNELDVVGNIHENPELLEGNGHE